MEKYVSSQPYTAEEREADKAEQRAIGNKVYARRKNLRQRYASKATPVTRRNTLRMLGERDE